MFKQSLKPYTKDELKWMMACLKFEWDFMNECRKNRCIDDETVRKMMRENQWEQVTLHWRIR